MSFSKINYQGLFSFVETQIEAKLGYSIEGTPTAATAAKNRVFTEFYIDVCRPLIFGTPMGASHINSIHNKWHSSVDFRVIMFFIMQQIAVYISDNNGEWEAAVATAVDKIIIPRITSASIADKEHTTKLFLANGWLFAAWVMQNTAYRKSIGAYEAAKTIKAGMQS